MYLVKVVGEKARPTMKDGIENTQIMITITNLHATIYNLETSKTRWLMP